MKHVLLLLLCLQGIIDEFKPRHNSTSTVSSTDEPASTDAPAPQHQLNSSELLINGLWQLILAAGLLLSSLSVVKARRWRYLKGWMRGFLADYGAPLMVVAWTGLSFALQGVPGVPRRVETPNTWEVRRGGGCWHGGEGRGRGCRLRM